MKIPLIILTLGFLMVGINALVVHRFTVNDVQSFWFVDGERNPDLHLIAGETAIFEFTFAGTAPHALRIKTRFGPLVPEITNQDNSSPPSPVNMTWANPQVGNYTYYCLFDTGMVGGISVKLPVPPETPSTSEPASSQTPTSGIPSTSPSSTPSSAPSSTPSTVPSSTPSTAPSSTPSSAPASGPIATTNPTSEPSQSTEPTSSSDAPNVVFYFSLVISMVACLALAF